MRVERRGSRVERQKHCFALRPRSALTLIELLVVVIILTTIVAAAIPILSPADDDRRLREAARGLNTFITGAQSRAIGSNRPFGVALKRLSKDTQRAEDRAACVEAFYVEQPAPYAGFDANSRAAVAIHPQGTNNHFVLVRFITRGSQTGDDLPAGWDVDLFPTGVIRPGDVIEIGGTRYALRAELDGFTNVRINNLTGYYEPQPPLNRTTVIKALPLSDASRSSGPSAGVPLNRFAMVRRGQQIDPKYDRNGLELPWISGPGTPNSPPPYWSSALGYKVLRQAVPASDEPYQLPEGTALDLRASGIGSNDFFYVPFENDNDDGVLIMFAPEGRVSRVTYSQLPITPANGIEPAMYDQPTVENIFLLVGRRANAPPPAVSADPTLAPTTYSASPPKTEDQIAELREPVNWLLGSSRWVVIGSQSGRIATIENDLVSWAQLATMSAPTETARNAQILAARAFTREMAQLGGR